MNDPTDTIAEFELQSGSRVADLGSGSGAFALAAARAVGEAGKVYAVEVRQELAERLRSEARAARLQNLETLWGDIERAEGTHLGSGSMDAVIASHILFQVEDRAGFVEETRRILRMGGRVLLVEGIGKLFSGVPEKEAIALFARHGFIVLKKLSADKDHYSLVFKKA